MKGKSKEPLLPAHQGVVSGGERKTTGAGAKVAPANQLKQEAYDPKKVESGFVKRLKGL